MGERERAPPRLQVSVPAPITKAEGVTGTLASTRWAGTWRRSTSDADRQHRLGAGTGGHHRVRPGGLGGDAFLKLLVAQLRFQNPMEPTDASAMLGQTAQFTQVETLQQLARTQAQLAGLSQTGVAAGMVGQDVSAVDAEGRMGDRHRRRRPLLRHRPGPHDRHHGGPPRRRLRGPRQPLGLTASSSARARGRAPTSTGPHPASWLRPPEAYCQTEMTMIFVPGRTDGRGGGRRRRGQELLQVGAGAPITTAKGVTGTPLDNDAGTRSS